MEGVGERENVTWWSSLKGGKAKRRPLVISSGAVREAREREREADGDGDGEGEGGGGGGISELKRRASSPKTSSWTPPGPLSTSTETAGASRSKQGIRCTEMASRDSTTTIIPYLSFLLHLGSL